MSRDEKENGKEFTFMKEQIIPKRKSRLKRIVIAFSATVILAILFGMIARITFIVSEPMLNRLLGIDTNKKPVTLTNEENQQEENFQKNNQNSNQQAAISSSSEDKDAEGQEETREDAKDSKNGETDIISDGGKNKEETTVNHTYYVEKKIPATVDDLVTMYADLKKVANQAYASIVPITCKQEKVDVLENPYSRSSEIPGLIVGNNGVEFLILVSYDGIKQASSLEATFSGNTKVPAELLEYDKNTGLAVLAVKLSELTTYVINDTKVASLGESYLLTNGTPILAVGSPTGASSYFDFGIITSCSGVEYLTDIKLDLFHTSMNIPEQGQGYIINLDGFVVGIISHREREESQEDVCTIIGITRIKKLVEKMMNGEERVYVGVIAEDMSAEALEDAQITNGIYVSEVLAKSPAYQAGIQSGDIIVSINESPVSGVNSFVSLMDHVKYKDEITVEIVRFINKTAKNVKVDLVVGKVKK